MFISPPLVGLMQALFLVFRVICALSGTPPTHFSLARTYPFSGY